MRKWLLIIVCVCTLVGCKEYQVSDNPSLTLAFSCDTLSFDTVFTAQGSATMQLMVYNRNTNAMQIDRIWLSNGTAFRVNVDGEADLTRLTDLVITFTDTLPYLILDSFVVNGPLTIQAGAQLYMHRGACLFAQGDVEAQGTKDAPILIRGDRLDRLFDSVPYAYAGGSWDGVYLLSEQPQIYDLNYVDILSGNVGLYCVSSCVDPLPQLHMDGCRIHNHARYGLVLSHVDALVTNTEISNCASYCVYCSGGTHQFIHSTIASYFGYTNIRIQSVSKDESAAVYIDNLSKTKPTTNTSFLNSIITGYLTNQVVVATPFDQYYPGSFIGNYLKTDTLRMPHAAANVYWQSTDTAKVFVNDFYKYKEYIYYDFRLDSLSPAIGIGDSLVALPYPTDKNCVSRANLIPDAGCYQHQP